MITLLPYFGVVVATFFVLMFITAHRVVVSTNVERLTGGNGAAHA